MKLSVTGETDVGWCAATPPNETTDDEGNPVFRQAGFSAADPRAPTRRAYDHPDVQNLRDHLRSHNGMPGLEIVEPHEVERATRIFFRDGFVVVRDLLEPRSADGISAPRAPASWVRSWKSRASAAANTSPRPPGCRTATASAPRRRPGSCCTIPTGPR